MDRRQFLAGVAATSLAGIAVAQTSVTEQASTPTAKGKFKLNYAPHLGMFDEHAGKDPIDQIKFMADQGFTAFEDNGMLGRAPELQDKIAAELKRLNMTMGVFVAHADFKSKTFVQKDPEIRKTLVEQLQKAVELSKRIGNKWCTVVLGMYASNVDWGYQTANAVENLRACAEICEPAGLVMVLEPLNKRDHPGLFLTGVPQAYAICKAVNSPSCKILDDFYHQQVTEGNLIPNMDAAWDEIGYFQVGDNPGRKEPTTGEINYLNVFKHIHQKGYQGVIGMEHGLSKKGKEGEIALLEAYRAVDAF